jgi:hypothetical protein
MFGSQAMNSVAIISNTISTEILLLPTQDRSKSMDSNSPVVAFTSPSSRLVNAKKIKVNRQNLLLKRLNR